MLELNQQLQVFIYGYNLTILFALAMFIGKNKSVHSNATRHLRDAILWTMLLLVSEGVSWILGPNFGTWSYGLLFLTNSLGYACSIFPVLTFFKYLDTRIVKREFQRRQRGRLYGGIGLFYVALALLNVRGRFLFDLLADGTYVRGVGMYLTSILAIFILLSYVALNFQALRTVEGRIVSVLLLFTVLPVMGIGIQIFYYGLPSLWSFFTLLLLFTYVVVERDALMRDPLTGLLNRGHFEERVRYKLKINQSFSVLMIDLNAFKAINDQYGHHEGDEALIIVSRMLQRCVKRRDLVCRYGGDEFVILLESGTSTMGEQVRVRIERALVAINEKRFKPYEIQMSMGVFYVQSGMSLTEKEVLQKVDAKMYENKKSR